jgi:regulator of protease activity HflC (stomatin/prohibitin superfamily)
MKKGKQPKRMEYKNAVLKSPGLTLMDDINESYGSTYKNQDEASFYSGCLKACGCVQACYCFICASCGCGPITEIKQGYIGLRVEFGKLTGKLGPGLHTYNACSEKIITVDMRVQNLNVSKQVLLTKDSVTIHLDVFVYFKIVVPEYALYKTSNYFSLLNLMVQAVMKTVVSERTLAQLLVNRKEIEKSTTHLIDEKAHPFGIDVISIETQSIQLPRTMERAMAIVAESEKRSEAKVIDAKGNLESAKIFRQAADELIKNPVSVELQYFEVLKGIASESPSTIIVPDSIMSTINRRLGK